MYWHSRLPQETCFLNRKEHLHAVSTATLAEAHLRGFNETHSSRCLATAPTVDESVNRGIIATLYPLATLRRAY